MDLKQPENILELIQLQKRLFKKYYQYMNTLIRTKYKNAALLTYWLRDYLRYLKAESTFNPRFNMKYKRGQIVYVNFGYRIGSELGGCHYAIVLDVHNSQSNSQITVVPMKSKRDKETSYSKTYHVDIGSEIQTLLDQKALCIINKQLPKVQKLIQTHGLTGVRKDASAAKQVAATRRQVQHAREIHEFATNKLNHESVADVGQICTVSKIRIVYPVKNNDVLADICLSEYALGKIEKKMQYLFFGNDS